MLRKPHGDAQPARVRQGGRDLSAAGDKAAQQASLVKKEDAAALGGIFEKAVNELKEIRKNLTPTTVSKGGTK